MLVNPIISDSIVTCSGQYELNIQLKYNVILVSGQSGSGRTFMFNLLRSKYGTCSQFVFIDGKIDASSAYLLSLSGKLIIVDSADNFLTPELRRYIGTDAHNQYLLFGRDPSLLMMSIDQIYEVKCTSIDSLHKFIFSIEPMI